MLLACLDVSWAVKPEGACLRARRGAGGRGGGSPSNVLPSSGSTVSATGTCK